MLCESSTAMDGKTDTHKWTSEETRLLIKFRSNNEQRFLRSKSASKQLWETLIKELGLEGKVTPQQVSKKWENLKKKYKELKTPKTGSGTDGGEKTAANWQYFLEMDEVLGARPSISPPSVIASYETDPTALLMEIVEPGCFHGTPSSPVHADCASSATWSPSTPTPSPKKKRQKSNPILEFLMEESVKEQKRHEETEEKTERFLSLFEKMIEKL